VLLLPEKVAAARPAIRKWLVTRAARGNDPVKVDAAANRALIEAMARQFQEIQEGTQEAVIARKEPGAVRGRSPLIKVMGETRVVVADGAVAAVSLALPARSEAA
jgi:hypothetical protein